MSEKLVISEYTHRRLGDQRAAHPDKPVFVLPDDLESLLRPTTRKENPTFHCVSLAVLAKDAGDFRDFVDRAWRIGATILSDADGVLVKKHGIVAAEQKWKAARKEGAAMIGAKESARVRADDVRIGCDAIKDEWPQRNFKTPELRRRANEAIGKCGMMHYRTIVARLGERPKAQWNYEAAQKRKERRNAKAN